MPTVPPQIADLYDTALWLSLAKGAIRVGITLAIALAVLAVVKRIKRRWIARAQASSQPGRRMRVLTLADLLGSVARYVVWSIALVTILSDVGVEIGPLLASAGVAGLAIGFGAQTLVKDVISGFFLLFDDTIGYGDLITFGGQTATVEYVGLRLIKARKFDGELLMIPAGEIRTFGNKSVGYARAIVDVSLSYEQDIDEAMRDMESIARAWSETEAGKDALLGEDPEVQGILSLDDSGVQARIVAKVRPGTQFPAEREMRRLVKDRFAKHGIPQPMPSRTVYLRTEGDAAPPPETKAATGGA